MAETREIIGRLPVNRGAYAEGQTYYKDNIVTYGGQAWTCTTDGTTGAPADGVTGWTLFAAKGAAGAAGAQGPKGDKGDTGATGAQGPKGDTGAAFTYDMFTEEQLAALKGPKGDTGEPSPDALLKTAQTLTADERTQVKANLTKGGYARELYEAAGAKYNETTGFWELNGLTDITWEQIATIYRYSSDYSWAGNRVAYFKGTPIRTNFLKGAAMGWVNDVTQLFFDCKNLEIAVINDGINFTWYSPASGASNMCYGCIKLTTILGVLPVKGLKDSNLSEIFKANEKLKTVKVWGLGADLPLKDCAAFSYESLKYMVDNAANTTAITITVHPTIYGYLTGTATPDEAHGGTADEWTALVTTAQEKNITFANGGEA